MIDVLISSKSVEWETPQEFFDELNAKYRFTTDVCATASNSKCKHFFSKEANGLKQPWDGVCWMNPPYGRQNLKAWVEKAYHESKRGTLVVALLPARTDSRWFHQYVYRRSGVKVEFIKGRLLFGDGKCRAPFPSMLVVFGSKSYGA